MFCKPTARPHTVSGKYSTRSPELIVTIDEQILYLTSLFICHHAVHILSSKVNLGRESQ